MAIELYGVPSQGFSLQGRKKSRPYKLAKSVLYDKVDDNFSDCIYDRNASIPTINELMNKMNCDVYHIARTTKMVLMLHRMLYFAFFVPNWGQMNSQKYNKFELVLCLIAVFGTLFLTIALVGIATIAILSITQGM